MSAIRSDENFRLLSISKYMSKSRVLVSCVFYFGFIWYRKEKFSLCCLNNNICTVNSLLFLGYHYSWIVHTSNDEIRSWSNICHHILINAKESTNLQVHKNTISPQITKICIHENNWILSTYLLLWTS
jgi:hypothetical protein